MMLLMVAEWIGLVTAALLLVLSGVAMERMSKRRKGAENE